MYQQKYDSTDASESDEALPIWTRLFKRFRQKIMMLVWKSSSITKTTLNSWFSDESVFHLSGWVNRHNSRIWRKSNPEEILYHERDFPKLVIWCSVSSTGLTGLFFPRCIRKHVTVAGGNYLKMLKEFHDFRRWVTLLMSFFNDAEPLPTLPG